MEVRDYLRDEFLEEAALGIVDEAELQRRLALFDNANRAVANTTMTQKAQVPGATSPLSVNEDDQTLDSVEKSIPTSVGPLTLYLTRPTGGEHLPGVLLIHENQGLVAHIKDVARRLAKLGYVVVAPDLLTPAGGAESFPDAPARIAALGTLDREEMVTQLLAGFEELSVTPGVDADNLGVMGFCFGGGMTWMVITKEPRAKRCV